MRYKNTYNAKLAMSRIMVSLPRNTLCRRTSRPFNKAKEGSAAGQDMIDDPDDERGNPATCVLFTKTVQLHPAAKEKANVELR